MLSNSENSGEEEEEEQGVLQLAVNEHFAKAYQARKEREELQKLKDKYGSDFEEGDASDESTDSESAESEDEDGEELTPAVDAAILRTLARIKRKDPTIYETGKDVYEEEQQRVTNVPRKKKAKDKSKPVVLRQAALEASLRPESRSPSPELAGPTHVEEQRELRDETIAAFHGAMEGRSDDNGDGNEDDGGGGLLVPRGKTRDELELEEEEYKAFLEKEVGSDLENLITVEKIDVDENAPKVGGEETKKKTKTKNTKGRTKEEEDHEFLMNYILNRGWVDKSSQRIPTYKEVTSKKSKRKSKSASKPDAEGNASDTKNDGADDATDGSDTSFESLVDHFEASYNFRFEEPGAATIQTFPRNLPDTVRRQESTRKDARARRRERKHIELEQKREEVKRLKSLKMKEMRKKLEQIGKEGGRNKDLDEDHTLQHLDLDADWDSDAHDKQMAELYGNDGDAIEDDKKPTWDDDVDIGDIVPAEDQGYGEKKDKKKKKKKKKKNESEDDEGGVDIDEMDADVVRDEADEEEWDGTEEMRKRKLKEYWDELGALDFNDMAGGMATRFRYVPIKAESFALNPVEILVATDKELNQYMGIKKYAPYRHGIKWDNQRNEKLRELKQAIAERTVGKSADGQRLAGLTGDGMSDGRGRRDGEEKRAKKRKGRKERLRVQRAGAEVALDKGDVRVDGGEHGQKKRKREVVADAHTQDAGLDSASYLDQGDPEDPGAPSKKRKKRQQKKKTDGTELTA